MKNIVIITAGGSGTRISNEKKKQFIQIMDRPLLFWTIDKFVD
ncbi:MAG: 2-C-methyl-D-erythritol 4-phosphate cytidylyltransferase, partial [Candidatus Cloacimonetes bacterium]|nr:2-C-methyl-D-erythritol 4-phosphate cytidylyltransferase [Candidatus Cloacimonadota bacterium]MBT4332029.1 2-C-methyl-D-erythritol 4-phosphate cytidylyltransferase [Candidatus Cloacimonadota bacterium]